MERVMNVDVVVWLFTYIGITIILWHLAKWAAIRMFGDKKEEIIGMFSQVYTLLVATWIIFFLVVLVSGLLKSSHPPVNVGVDNSRATVKSYTPPTVEEIEEENNKLKAKDESRLREEINEEMDRNEKSWANYLNQQEVGK